MGSSEYPDDLRPIGEAALTLASLKRARVDPSTIDELKRKIRDDGISHNTTSRKYSSVSHELALDHDHVNAAAKRLDGSIWRLVCNHTLPPIPPVPCLSGLIGRCSKPFEKQLTTSDVKQDQSRLSMNRTDVERCLLPMLNEDEDPKNEIKVTTYDPKGNQFSMVFKSWGSKFHVLTKGWNPFFMKHNLKEHQDFVTLWMFRNLNTGKLCFVITWRRLPIEGPLKKMKRIELITG